jgi:hypothetical protein
VCLSDFMVRTCLKPFYKANEYSCAIASHSPLFANQSKSMYDRLVSATVYTSDDMYTNLVVSVDGARVQVESEAASLMVECDDEEGLRITLPLNKTERKRSMRGQLAGRLAELLEVHNLRGDKQLYRIMNELDTGTDDIMDEENISHVTWLTRTSRPSPQKVADDYSEIFEDGEETSANEADTTQTSRGIPNDEEEIPANEAEFVQESNGQSQQRSASRSRTEDSFLETPDVIQVITQRLTQRVIEIRQFAENVPAADDVPLHYAQDVLPPPPPYRALPEALNHRVEAPDYWKVLEHARKQAQSLGSGVREPSDPANDDVANLLGGLNLGTVGLEAIAYQDLFGKDVWMSRFRVGAAGELFVGLRQYPMHRN